MQRPPRRNDAPYRFDDFFSLMVDDRVGDLLNASLYFSVPDMPQNNHVPAFVACLLRGYGSSRKRSIDSYFARVAFVIDDRNCVMPDIGVLCPEKPEMVLERYIDGPPDLAVEVVAYNTVERDYEVKYEVYQAAGVQEYC